MNEGLKVLKRDNKKVEFNGEKIAIAIKKSFDSREEFIEKYTDEDVNKVYTSVLDDIYDNYFEKPYIKVEEIQDIIEKQLLKLKYSEVYESFSNYRDKRSESRKIFLSEPKQHKLLKAIEKLTLKQDWAKKDSETQIEVIFNYGKIISEEFANAYFINNKFTSLHESGQIYINDIEYVPMGLVESLVVPFDKLLEKGFNIENKNYKVPTDIMSCMSIMPLIIRKTLEDVSGGIGLSNFDYNIAPFILKTFKEELKQKIFEFLDLSGFSNFVDFDSIAREINKIESINFDKENLYKFSKDVEQIKQLFDEACYHSLDSTKKISYNSIYNFLHNSCFKVGNRFRKVTVDLGMDTSIEGRIVTESYIMSLDKDVSINTVFKLKNDINYDKKSPNYDLFNMSLKTDYNMNYSCLDTKFNKKEVFYFEDGIRIFENINSEESDSISRGLLSRTYINLSRIAIKNKNQKETIDDFISDLDKIFDLVKEQLLERFDVQSSKKSSEFPFLIGENLYMDSKGLKPLEKIKKSIRNGNLGIGVIGLNECIKEIGIEEDKLLSFLKMKIQRIKEDTKLNFVLIGPNIDISKKFIDLDRTIYGDIKGFTDKEYYDVNYNCKNTFKIFDGGCFKKTKINSMEDFKKIDIENYGFISIEKEVD